ncbi:Gfo/Idh/MocA family oxidoreductase [Porifericola rhodea]|uniref:Gfo/Idh/MocA family protein n=1 Tax=Porifericola rhodea TaxID=930972 RepID=UPI00266623FB|nr:Gfo/Idh/MocA family oxidoreductase [Porifericola rhodea]WKN30891.1 Gfo/Idh/MocA family oxidoreductase [Porifericola rhodea]
MSNPINVLVVGCGNMGASHAKAYHKMPEFNIVGLVSRGAASREKLAEELGGNIALFDNIDTALETTKADAVSINTYPDTHYEYILKSFKAGAHVFCEKPLAETVEKCEEIAKAAKEYNKKLLIGYIVRVHPAWKKFIEISKTLGKPLVMRMNLNQQSSGTTWETHKNLMKSMSPIVDCGVHYVDVMCLMTEAQPIRVSAIGARLSDEIQEGMYNYGQLQVTFSDGSVGWYEAGWGPMMSETAFFVKDVVGPKGCVSIMDSQSASDDVDAHSKTNALKVHKADRDTEGKFTIPDEIVSTADEPDHQGLCDLEQELFLKAIKEDLDLSQHHQDAINSMKIVLAADESFKTGKTVELK